MHLSRYVAGKQKEIEQLAPEATPVLYLVAESNFTSDLECNMLLMRF